MEKLKKLHDELENMRFDLQDNYRTSLKERFEIVGEFVENELKDAISIIDYALDRIQELEDELEEANEKIEVLEREANVN